jgi:hypothetical protein
MKYLLVIIAFLLGVVIGHFVLNKHSNKLELVLKQTPDTTLKGPANNFTFSSALLPVSDAEHYLQNFRTTHSNSSSIAFSIDSAHAAGILAIKTAAGGLRAYFGVKDINKPEQLTLMFVGIDVNRENVFEVVDGTEYVYDYTNPCPKDCPEGNRLTIKHP